MKDRALMVIAVSAAVIVVVTMFFAIRILAENRTHDFVIDNFVMDQGLYGSREEAMEGVVISEMHWGFSGFCTVATAYLDHKGARISTSIALKMPVLRYAFNTAGRDDVVVVGSC